MKTLLRLSLFCCALFITLLCHAQPPYVIPVVFHILHTGETDNISDAQVLDAVRILNEDYNMANPDISLVASSYMSIVGNMQITFRLASIDPNGQCTNGIERIYTNQTYSGSFNSSKIHQWPPEKYLNIWVYTKMSGGVGGYTYPPFAANFNAEYDGIAFINDYIGSIGTSNSSRSRALTHETGTYLGLLDVGQEHDCIDADSVGDTPPTTDISYCSPNIISCNGVDTANYQNFMAYSYCSNMFTKGQRGRVHNVLNTYSTRTNLSKPANLVATGTSTNNPTACAPIADFYTTRVYACVGDSVKLVDASYNGRVTGRLWQFANSDISTAIDSVVYVRFNNAGWQSITLTVTNAQGSNSVTKQLVYVRNPQQLTAPYYTGFDDANDFDINWAVVNRDNDLPRFSHVTVAGHTHSTSILLNNNVAGVTGNMDELYTPAFDCSQLTNTDAKLNFWYSGATTGYFQPKDSLVVYASKNCGKSWTRLYSISGQNLANAGVVSAPFQPNDTTLWKRVSISIPGPSSNNNFRLTDVSFKFQVFGADSSNNFYLDDFSIGIEPDLVLGINDLKDIVDVKLIPNPFKNTLAMHNIPEGAYTVDVSNAQGQLILHHPNREVNQSGNLQLNMEGQPVGTYFITLRSSKATTTIQAVKQ